ncbi:hypothetical protein AAFM46_13520 [Arthrobacter sp. TMP15]|uniref:hypothetical protein n=1 Tax=Arthrobacter sp. TMP15 TaxID=3140789 RepID=UPI0031B9CB05
MAAEAFFWPEFFLAALPEPEFSELPDPALALAAPPELLASEDLGEEVPPDAEFADSELVEPDAAAGTELALERESVR